MAGLFQTPENPNSENYAVHLLEPQSPSLPSDQTRGVQADATSDDGTMIGVVGTFTSTMANDTVEANLGYIFHPSSWGKGFATEAIMTFMRGFWDLQPSVQVIRAEVDPRNVPSTRVLQKCGFVEIETIRGGRSLPMIDLGGEPRDLMVFKIQRPVAG
ncbi:hypothetical protein FQN54_009635 [Arachnomyces sp. PD_36]|nr:hypothetical protein FQN54_009635 [Arachnomyces sp. PD_36]